MLSRVALTNVQVRRVRETGVGRAGGQSPRVHQPTVHEQPRLGPAQCYGHGVPMAVGKGVRKHFGVNAAGTLGDVV